MSLIKEVRLKWETTNSSGYTESISNYKLCLEEGRKKNDRMIRVKRVDKETKQESYDTNLELYFDYNRRYKDFTDDDYIDAWISTQNNKLPGSTYFSILQNPWLDDLPVKRNYGTGDYYLSNGSRVNIKWTSKLDFTYQNGEIKTAYGYEYDEDSDTYIDSGGDVLPDYLFNNGGRPGFNLFGKLISNFTFISGERWSDDEGNEIGTRYVDNQKLPPIGGYSFGLEKSYDELLAMHVDSVLAGSPTTYFENDHNGDLVPVYNFYGEPYDGVGLPFNVSMIKGEAIEKTIVIRPDSESEDVDTYGYFQISEDNKIKPFSEVKIGSTQSESKEKKWDGSIADKDILNEIISFWKKQVPDYDIEICNFDQLTSSGGSEFCRLVEYKSPIDAPPDPEPPKETEESEQGKDGIKLTVVLPEDLELKVKEDLDDLKVYIGDPPLNPGAFGDFVFQDDFDNLEELDPEFYESSFSAEEESPESIPEVPLSSNSNPESSSESEFKPGTSTPGERVTLPETYSHSDAQGFNLLNSQWIGNIIVSAKSHIKTPTYDVSGTDKGNLGCASAVSIIFYRAFGVHMKTGSAVREKPTSIGHFGSKGTAELSGWFEAAPNLYQKIPWESAQPGDIMNTARNFSTNKAGHIGIVIDVKDKDGSWAIVSNSSKGFAGGGGGAVKQNYSVKKWSSVTKRNPSKTFAFRYIGPSLATQA